MAVSNMLLQVVDILIVVFALLLLLAEGAVGSRGVQAVQEPVVKVRRTTATIAWNEYCCGSLSRHLAVIWVAKFLRLLLVIPKFSFLCDTGSLP